MNHRIRVLTLGVFSALSLQTIVRADVLHLKTGGKLEGVVTRETASTITLDLGMGEVSVPTTSIQRIERKESPLSEFRNRAAAIVPGNVVAYADLARFAGMHGLRNEARMMWERVLAFDPRNGEAHQGLGHVLLDGYYVDEEQAYRARGFVQFEGRWMSSAEQASILREREQRIASEQQVAEARRAARDAEERAARAEADAERARAEANVWSPVWGYGGGYLGGAYVGGSPYWAGQRYPGRYFPGYPGCPGPACVARPPHVTPHGSGGGPASRPSSPAPAARPVRPTSIR